jgi:hypothetical protein
MGSSPLMERGGAAETSGWAGATGSLRAGPGLSPRRRVRDRFAQRLETKRGPTTAHPAPIAVASTSVGVVVGPTTLRDSTSGRDTAHCAVSSSSARMARSRSRVDRCRAQGALGPHASGSWTASTAPSDSFSVRSAGETATGGRAASRPSWVSASLAWRGAARPALLSYPPDQRIVFTVALAHHDTIVLVVRQEISGIWLAVHDTWPAYDGTRRPRCSYSSPCF